MSGFPRALGLPQSLPGAVTATRYVGGTAAGAPVSGTFRVGDYVVNADASIFVCTVAGTPGTWVDTATVGPSVSSVFGRSGAVVAAANDYTYAQIAASAGAIAITNLAAGLAGQMIGGTTPAYAYPPGFEISYDQITAAVNIVSTSSGTPTAIIAGTSHTYENVPYIFHFFTPALKLPSTTGGFAAVLLMEDGSPVGEIGEGDNDITGGQTIFALKGEKRHTPTAGAHTYAISAYVSATTGTPSVGAGAGTTTTVVPAFLRVTKV